MHNIARVGYDSQYNSGTGLYEYNYTRMGSRVTLQCPEPFFRGDCVSVVAVDDAAATIRLQLEPGVAAGRVPSALMIVSPGFPLDPEVQHRWRESRCSVLLRVRATMTGNMTYIIALLAPLRGRSSLSATAEHNGDTFHFFLSERSR